MFISYTYQMELRKDPITRSWVRVGHRDDVPIPAYGCPLCAERSAGVAALLELPSANDAQVRVIPHFHPLYGIEGEPGRTADGIYDRMRPLGAHEIIIESQQHNQTLAGMSDEQIERVLQAYAMRILDLKRDARFKYVTVFENRGALAGSEWAHPYSQVTATLFVPRRILYELSSARQWYAEKERCVFCDIVRQEERQGKRIVDTQGDYVAFCPYASRVPFETWVLPRRHNHLFELPRHECNRRHLATLLGRTLRRLTQVAESYHLVLHTAPNIIHPKGELSSYWRTIADDFHWHIEILPIVEHRSKSYSIKEVYFNALLPEQAAQRLRELDATVNVEPTAAVDVNLDVNFDPHQAVDRTVAQRTAQAVSATNSEVSAGDTREVNPKIDPSA
jgi:UDPglucose--hexose-1-phosphate uridylyltransferase